MDKLSRLVFIILILFLLTLGYLHPALAVIPATERGALIALYNSTDGDNWNNKNGWKDGPLDSDGFDMPGTENTWYGIGVDSDSVTSISLWSNNLTGGIPDELGNLGNLQELWLTSNHLSGSIPVEVMCLVSLIEINICNNNLYVTDPDLRNFLDSLQPGWEACQTVAIDECYTGVENRVLSDGRTISERIEECMEEVEKHGEFVRNVAHLLNELKKAGIITGQEMGAIQSCAAKADIP